MAPSQDAFLAQDAFHARDVFYAHMLATLDVAVCVFDDSDRTVLWNEAFLSFFPEHRAHIYPGEPYRANLRRFYLGRLSPEAMPQIERYIEEGVVRHRQQTRPFLFVHHGRRLQVASLPCPGGGRVRIWRALTEDAGPAATGGMLPFDLLDHIPEGAMMLDAQGRILAANREFRSLYDVAPEASIVGLAFDAIVAGAWRDAGDGGDAALAAVANNLRYSGAPFEIALPGERWRRVMARPATNGVQYFTHSDISALKRQHRELQVAEARARAGEAALRRAHDELAAIAATDGLTGLANRRHFDRALEARWDEAARGARPISLLMVDIDRFKSINDRFGHLVGDDCLRQIGAIIRRCLREPEALAARYGGEEFAVLLPATGHRAGLGVARAIREGIASGPWRLIHPLLDRISVSIGLCSAADPGSAGALDLVRRADAMLYKAKHGGRDRLEGARLRLAAPPEAKAA